MSICELMAESILFQFHKGTIRTIPHITIKLILFHFNSIKVQLERQQLRRLPYKSKFQFHKGTIRTYWLTENQGYQIHFNSIKVQLERSRKRE